MLKRFPGRGSRALPYLGSILAAAALFARSTPAAAAELRQGDVVLVGSGETIHDDLYAVGQTVTILGTVDGDVFAAGSNVTIDGAVSGSVFAAGGTVTVNADVQRSLRAAGGSIAVRGTVADDALLAGGMIDLATPSRVGRDLLIGGSADVAAPVGRNVLAAGGDLALSAPVGGDVRADIGSLRLASAAAISGALVYTSDRPAEIAADATVGGPIQHQTRPGERGAAGPATSIGSAAVDWLRGLVGVLAFGLLLLLLVPGITPAARATLLGRPWPSLGLGFGIVVGTPIAAVVVLVLGLLVGGWWLALLLLPVYVIALIGGYTLSALTLGQWLAARLGRTAWHAAWALLIGLFVYGVVGLVPILGGLVLTAAATAGLGAWVLVLVQMHRGAGSPIQQPAEPAQPRIAPAPTPTPA